MKLNYFVFIAFLFLFIQTVNASHIIDYRIPTTIVTTVGKLTTVQMDIQNGGASATDYRLILTATLPNEIDITNWDIHTQTLNPGESISIFTNIRTLTESPNVLKISVYPDSLSAGPDVLSLFIIITSKKYSLPEFGLMGFLQIITLSGVAYFLFKPNRIK